MAMKIRACRRYHKYLRPDYLIEVERQCVFLNDGRAVPCGEYGWHREFAEYVDELSKEAAELLVILYLK